MVVDLRSDTVTRPTAAMRAAIAHAEVGDDVFGDDPTVKLLQERVAALIGTEAALFVPSGTMANQIALRAHTRPGDEILIGKDTHCWRHESGALAALAGVQTQMMAGHMFTADEVRAGYRPDDPYAARIRVVVVENTHGHSGGMCWDRAQLAEVTDAAHALGLATHLDGARLWNAAVASGTTEAELARGFDSVSVCLSKGLGAPIGSLVCGQRDFIKACHRFRKMYGGGMRQTGLLAAAGLHALDHHRGRLGEDHANARAFAEALVGHKHVAVDLARVHTNIVMFTLASQAVAEQVVTRAKQAGVLLGYATVSGRGLGLSLMRAVTHLDVDREGVLRAARVIGEIADSL